MIKNKNKTKQYIYNKEKKSLAENRTWTICTESRFLDHCATLPRIKLTGKLLYLKYYFLESLPVHSQSSHLELLSKRFFSRSDFKFRGSNDDRNGNY